MTTSSSQAVKVHRIIESYELVKADSDFKRNTEWYFDAFDVVKILQGYFAFDYGSHFDKDSFRASRDLYVHCFASKGWLGNIRMLPPHEEEMLSKIHKLFKSTFPIMPELALTELLPDLNLTKFMKDSNGWLGEAEIRKYAKELREDAGQLFKISSILEMPTWFERYGKLIRKEGTIKFEQDTFDQAALTKKSIYRLILKAIKEQRPYDRYEKNNHMDALALTMLHEKLVERERDHSSPIPVFYSSHPVVKRALRTIQEQDPKIFAYLHRGKYYSIVRDPDYFIIDQIINFERDKKPVEFFNQITLLKDTIERIYQNYKLEREVTGSEFKNFEDEINTTVLNEFLHYVWLEQDGIRNLGDGIEQVIKFNENKERVQKLFITERDDFIKKYEKPIRISRLSTNLWKALPDSLRRFAKNNNDNISQANFDIFLTFGLLRFGLDKPTIEPIIQEKFNSIFSSIQKIRAVEQQPVPAGVEDMLDRSAEMEFLYEVSNLISELISGVSTGKQDEHFVAGLGILWMLEELDMIVEICDMLEYNYDYYQVAFLHSASIALNSLSRRDAVIKITEMVEKKLEQAPNHPYYNIWIGLAFTRFNMWFMEIGRPTLPELGEIDYTSNTYKDNYLKSINLLKQAITNLGMGIGADSSRNHRKIQKYYYALNNLIYYTTKGGSPSDFENLAKYVEEFASFEDVPNIWQNRFYDTLAWYNYRHALQYLAKGDNAMFKHHIKIAERKNETALERPFSKRDKGIFERLKERIDRTKAENDQIFK